MVTTSFTMKICIIQKKRRSSSWKQQNYTLIDFASVVAMCFTLGGVCTARVVPFYTNSCRILDDYAVCLEQRVVPDCTSLDAAVVKGVLRATNYMCHAGFFGKSQYRNQPLSPLLYHWKKWTNKNGLRHSRLIISYVEGAQRNDFIFMLLFDRAVISYHQVRILRRQLRWPACCVLVACA